MGQAHQVIHQVAKPVALKTVQTRGCAKYGPPHGPPNGPTNGPSYGSSVWSFVRLMREKGPNFQAPFVSLNVIRLSINNTWPELPQNC